MSARRSYATDLSDEEWRILEPLVPEAKPGGRPRSRDPRAPGRHLLTTVPGTDTKTLTVGVSCSGFDAEDLDVKLDPKALLDVWRSPSKL